jgi:hypothetical protein
VGADRDFPAWVSRLVDYEKSGSSVRDLLPDYKCVSLSKFEQKKNVRKKAMKYRRSRGVRAPTKLKQYQNSTQTINYFGTKQIDEMFAH